MLRKSLLNRGTQTIPSPKGLIITKTKNSLVPSAPGIATITLSRPKQKNSITQDMYKGIIGAFEASSKDPEVGAVVLTGSLESDYFCSGNDLKNLVAFGWPRELSRQAKEMCFDFVQSFIDCEKPIVVGVTGPAIGIAVTTLALCDYRFCTPQSTFNTPFKALAQAPEGCSSHLFPKMMGQEMAKKMLVDGYTMPAAEAVRLKFMHELVERADMGAKCEKTAMELACGKLKLTEKVNGAEPLTGKRMCLANADQLRLVNRHEVEVLEEAWVSKECITALEKFMEKKGNKQGAFAMRLLNKTRFIWDRK
jgi:peroxisomal 3,2-trans-enoyl-CoA isomerase